MKLTKLQKEIREKLIIDCVDNYKDDYNLTYQEIGQIFHITKQAVRKMELKVGGERINKRLGIG